MFYNYDGHYYSLNYYDHSSFNPPAYQTHYNSFGKIPVYDHKYSIQRSSSDPGSLIDLYDHFSQNHEQLYNSHRLLVYEECYAQKSSSNSSLKQILNARNLVELMKKDKSKIKDPYVRHVYEMKFKELSEKENKSKQKNSLNANQAIKKQTNSKAPIFIPPDQDKLLKPTIRGVPSQFDRELSNDIESIKKASNTSLMENKTQKSDVHLRHAKIQTRASERPKTIGIINQSEIMSSHAQNNSYLGITRKASLLKIDKAQKKNYSSYQPILVGLKKNHNYFNSDSQKNSIESQDTSSSSNDSSIKVKRKPITIQKRIPPKPPVYAYYGNTKPLKLNVYQMQQKPQNIMSNSIAGNWIFMNPQANSYYLQNNLRSRNKLDSSSSSTNKPVLSRKIINLPKPNRQQKNSARDSSNLSDLESTAGSINDIPLPNDNMSEYSMFVNNVFSK